MTKSIVQLNRLSSTDILTLLPVLSDKRVTMPARLVLPDDPNGLKWAIQTLANNHYCFGIYIKRKPKPVGMICCEPLRQKDGSLDPHSFEISYLLDHQYWNHHLMTDAVSLFCHFFNSSDDKLTLYAKTALTNKASSQVLLNAGFKQLTTNQDGLAVWRWLRQEDQ